MSIAFLEGAEYDEAFRQMGAAPLEHDEAQPPRRRGRPTGQPNPNAGRKPRYGTPAEKLNVRIDPDLRTLIIWHANARGQTVTQSVNQLLGEALRTKEVDAEKQEVL